MKVKCTECNSEFSAQEILENSKTCWPNQGWIYFKCPTCKQYSHVQLKNGHLAIGKLDGAPGPCFCPSGEMEVPDLKVGKKFGGLSCEHGGKTYQFRGRR